MHPFINALDVLISYCGNPARVISAWINNLPTAGNAEIRKVSELADKFVDDVAEQIRKEPENFANSVMKNYVAAYDAKQVTREEFLHSIRLLFVAGHDTV